MMRKAPQEQPDTHQPIPFTDEQRVLTATRLVHDMGIIAEHPGPSSAMVGKYGALVVSDGQLEKFQQEAVNTTREQQLRAFEQTATGFQLANHRKNLRDIGEALLAEIHPEHVGMYRISEEALLHSDGRPYNRVAADRYLRDNGFGINLLELEGYIPSQRNANKAQVMHIINGFGTKLERITPLLAERTDLRIGNTVEAPRPGRPYERGDVTEPQIIDSITARGDFLLAPLHMEPGSDASLQLRALSVEDIAAINPPPAPEQ